jgi:hypothetical protein
MSEKKMEAMLTPVGKKHRNFYNKFSLLVILVDLDGKVSAKLSNEFVSDELINAINSWNNDGVSFDEVIDRLRLKCVPAGYVLLHVIQVIIQYIPKNSVFT